MGVVTKVVLVADGQKAEVSGFSGVAFTGKVKGGSTLVLDRFTVVGDRLLSWMAALDGKVIVAASGPVTISVPVGADAEFSVIVTLWGKGTQTVTASGEAYYTYEV